MITVHVDELNLVQLFYKKSRLVGGGMHLAIRPGSTTRIFKMEIFKTI